MVVGQAIRQHVVHEGTFGGCQRAVLSLIAGETARIVAGDLLHRFERISAGDLDLPHMAHVE